MNFNEALHHRRRRTMKEPPKRRRIEEKLSDFKSTRINGGKTRVTKMEDNTSIAHGKLHEEVPRLQYRQRQHRYRWKASWSSGLLILISIFSRHNCDAHPQQSRCLQEFASADKNNDYVLDSSEYLTVLKALSDDRLFQDVPNFGGLPRIFKDKFYRINSWYKNNKMNVWDDNSRIKNSKNSKRLSKPVQTHDSRQRLDQACFEINQEIDIHIATHTGTSLSHTMPQPASEKEDAIHLTQRRLDDSTPAPTPSLQQCRIGALLSDRNRNDYINQAEYVIFVNRLSDDYWDDVTSFDGLPLELRENYNSLAGSDTETGIFIFGARQSDDADADQVNFLIQICSDTSLSINEVIFGVVTPTNAPTSAPTPADNNIEPTVAPSSKPVLALPQCFAAMSTSDRNPRNAKLSKEEYPTFVNVLSKRELSFTSYDELPLILKVNFASVADEFDIIDIFGARRNENASPEQEEYLELVCQKTFEAVLIVLNPNPTPSPVTTAPPTAYPSANPSIAPTPEPVTPIEPSSSPSIAPSKPDIATAAPSVSPSASPSVQPLVVTVTSTFVIFNTAGLTAEDLQSGGNRDDLEAAYGTTVENTVANKDPPGEGDVSYVPSSGVIGSIEDIECPPVPGLSPDDLCQGVVATFQIITNADNGSVVEFVYENAAHEEIDNGTLEANIENINPATPINVAEGFRTDFTTAPSLAPSLSPSVSPSVTPPLTPSLSPSGDPDNEAPSASPSISFAPSPTTQTAAPSVAPTGKISSGPVEITANLVAKNALGPGTENLEPGSAFRTQFETAYDLTADRVTGEYNSQESTSRSLRTRYISRRRLEVSFKNSTVEEISDAEECPTGTDPGENCVNIYGSFFVEVTDEDADKVRFDLIKLMETSFDDGSFQEVLNALNSGHPLTVIPNVRPPNQGPTPTPAPKSGGGMSVLAIVGIAVAGTMGLAALGGTFAYVRHRKASQQAVRLDDMEVEGDEFIDDNNAPTMDLIEESQNDPFKDNVFPDVFSSQTDQGPGDSSQEPIPVVAKKQDKRRPEVQKYDPEDFDKYGEDEDSVGSLEDFPARESVSHAFSLGDDSQSDFNEYNFDDYSEGDLEQAQKIAGRATTEEELQQARRLGGVDYDSDSSSEGQSGWSTGDVNSSPDKSSNADREADDDGSSGAPNLGTDGPNLGAALGATAAGAALGVGAIAAMHSDSESEDSMVSDEGDSEVSGTDASESGSESGSEETGEFSESESGESSESESGESSEESSMESEEVSDQDGSAVSEEEESEESVQDGSETSDHEESEESEQENSAISDEGDSSGSEEDVSVESKQHDSVVSDQEEAIPEVESPSVDPVQASGEEQSLGSMSSAPVADDFSQVEDKASSPSGFVTETADKARSAPAIGSGEYKGPNIGLIAGTTAAAAAVTGAAIAIAKKKRNSDSDSEASASSHSDSVSKGEESGPSAHNSDVLGTERQTEGSHTRDIGATTRSPDGGDDGPNVGLIAGATTAAAAVTAAGLVAVTREASSKEEDSESDSEGERKDDESESDEEEGEARAETYLPTPYQDQEEHDERSDEFSFTESDTDNSTIESSTAELTPEEAQKRAEYRSEVEALVGTVVPDEIDNVDVMMVQFRGREAELVSTLRTMQERSVTQRARAAVHKSSKRPTRRLSRGPGSWRGNSPFSRESASSDSRGSAAGSAVIAAASVPRVTAGRPPVHMPPMPGAEREGSKAGSDLSDPVFSQKQGAVQPKSFASRLRQGDGDGDKSESSESDYVPNRMDSSGSSSGSASSGSSWKSESEEHGPNAWDGREGNQEADPEVDGKTGHSRSSKGMSQSAHSKGAESLGIEDLPSRWSGMPS